MMENQYWQQLMISLFITFFAYLTVPFCIYRYCENRCSPFFANWRKWIIVLNCIIVSFAFILLRFYLAGDTSVNLYPPVIWGWIAFRLFKPNEIIFPPESLRKNRKRQTVNPAPESAPQTVHNTDRENLPCSSLPAVKEIEQEQQSTQTPPSDPILPEPPKANKSEHSSLGIKKTTVYCCKACGCVIKKGTRVCPHCGAYIGPNKVRNARILAGVCAVLLCISLAGNFGLSLYVWELNNKAENDLAELKAENETLLTNRDILRTLLDSWKNKYREASEENWKLQSELEIFNSVTDGYDDLMAKYNEAVAYSEQLALEISAYRDTVALVNEYNTSYQYYHSIFCPKLHQSSFYVLSTDYARNTMHCSPCPECH